MICHKYELSSQLETIYKSIKTNSNSDVYSIMLFLILLQNINESKSNNASFTKWKYHPKPQPIDDLSPPDGVFDFVNEYQSHMFSKDNLRDLSNICDYSPIDCDASFMPDVSRFWGNFV